MDLTFTAEGVGAMLMAVQFGSGDLESTGPDLLRTDPMFLVLTLSGDVALRPPEELE